MLLVESRAVFRRRRFHRRKAHLVLSALRHRAAELGERARLVQAETYRDALAEIDEPLQVCTPTSWAAEEFVRSMDGVQVLPERGWVLTRDEFAGWAGGRRRLLQEDFYRDVRRRVGVLVEPDGSPDSPRRS